MSPTICFGDAVTIMDVQAKAGDVILIAGSPAILHRYIASAGNYVIHAGDGKVSAAGLVTKDRIVGVATGYYQQPTPKQYYLAAKRVAEGLVRKLRR